MTQPNIPGLITTAGTVPQQVQQSAQPGGIAPSGLVGTGALPTPLPQVPATGAPALPQAGAVLNPLPGQPGPAPQLDPLLLAQYVAAAQAQVAANAQTPPAQVGTPEIPAAAPMGAAPTPPPAPAMPTSIPALPQAAPAPVVPQAPAPVPVPQAPAAGSTVNVPGLASPVVMPQTATAPTTDQPVGNGMDDGAGTSYPNAKPIAEMTPDEKAAYSTWHSRRWEARAKQNHAEAEQLRAQIAQLQSGQPAPQAPAADAVAAARQQGYTEAVQAALPTLVSAHVVAGLQNRLAPEQVQALSSNLSYTHFLTADGMSVDPAKVATFVNTVAPTSVVPAATAPAAPVPPGTLPTTVPGQPATGLPRPDLGQGTPGSTAVNKMALGADRAKQFLAGNL